MEENKKYFDTLFQEFIYLRTYSRWIEEKQRRETWEETVSRYCNYMKDKYQDKISQKEYNDVYNAILNLEVMPSMRALWGAGKAIDAENIAIFNCSFLTIEKLKDIAEIMYILMCGTGVGYSIEKKYINKLPIIKEKNNCEKIFIIFEDSKMGWAKGFEQVLNCLWEGQEFDCDYSKIRPYGARLKTFGGRSSGFEPLRNLIDFTIEIVDRNRGFQLRSIDIYDIICKIAEIVVVGGIRRSACISLSDLTDNEMANAKMGEFWHINPQRTLANNSVAYNRKPDIISFLDEWKNLYRSKSGERGIFSRIAAQKKAKENDRRESKKIVGCNPCGEIILRSKSCCNLSEVIIRSSDTFDTLKKKIKIATIMGTWQAGFTRFKYLDKEWKKNCEEEALLGISLTGLKDHKILGHVNDIAKKWLADLKHIAIAANKKYAEKIGINRSAAITTIKPSGSVSLLVNSSPGAHVRPTETGYYIRRVRISAVDPLCSLLQNQDFPMKPEIGQSSKNCNTWVLEFCFKAPKEAKLKGESAREQLEYWQMLRSFYTEHNPSVTIYVKEDEWLDTAAWVYKNFDEIGGLTFLPYSDYVYQLAPYEDIDKQTYERLLEEMPKINFSKLQEYEKEDNTEGAKEYACIGDKCEII